MTRVRRPEVGERRRTAALFVGAFGLTLVVLAFLSHLGLPDSLVDATLTSLVLLAFIAAAIAARTMDADSFYTQRRTMRPVANGMATAAAFMSGAVFLGLAGAYFGNRQAAYGMALGWTFGFVLGSMLVSPYVQRTGAFGTAGFLSMRFGGRLVRLLAAIVVLAASLPALAAAIATAAIVNKVQLGLDERLFVLLFASAVGLVTVAGGMRSLSAAAILQYLVLALAFLVPAILVSSTRGVLPLPQLSFGFALEEAGNLASQAGEAAAALPGTILPTPWTGPVNTLLTLTTLAAGVAALPHLVMRAAVARDGDGARRNSGWALVFALAVILTAPAYAAFAHLGVFTELAGELVADLPIWVTHFGERGLLQICGVDAASLNRIATACATGPDPTGVVRPRDIALSQDAVVLAWPSLFGLPYTVSAVVGVGALSALMAAAGALTVAAGNALGHDIVGRLLFPRASSGRRLTATRLGMIAALAVGVQVALDRTDLALAMGEWGIALSAAGLFPVLAASVWWRPVTRAGALTGMAAGFALAFTLLAGADLDFGPVDLTAAGLPRLTAGFLGALVGTGTMMGVSLLSGPPSSERLSLLQAIRRPDGRLPDLPERD